MDQKKHGQGEWFYSGSPRNPTGQSGACLSQGHGLSEEGLPRGNLLPPGPGHPATSRLLRCSHPRVSGASQPPSTFPFYFRTMMFRTCSQLAPHGAPPLHHHRPAPSSQPHHSSAHHSSHGWLTVSHTHRWPALGDWLWLTPS